MSMDGESDGSDFKPFFDMIVGVLFILLILISAQMFFAQHSVDQSAVDNDAKRVSLERNKQIKSFLEDVAERLRKNGFDVDVDLIRRQLVLRLDQFSKPTVGGIPKFSDERVEVLGQILSDRLGCVFVSSLTPADCMDWKRLQLGEVQVEVRTGALPAETVLSPERFTQLASTLFSAALLGNRPALLSLTGAAGTPLFRFLPLLPFDHSPPSGPRGLLQLSFIFEP
jgi:hypothetical protein